MAVHVVRFRKNGGAAWGVLRDGRVLEIPGQYGTFREFLAEGESRAKELLGRSRDEGVPVDTFDLLAPVPTPGQVICLGANYRQHMVESGMDPDAKAFNMFFHKSTASVASPGTDIRRPPHVRLLDYEIEMALVVRREVNAPVTVASGDLHEYVAGITIANDVSARDVQLPQTQFFKGKSYRTFCPVGPYLCLLERDEMHCLDELELTLTVNGDVRQNDRTANLVFKPAETLTELSEFSDLFPGDLILTGTPAGCALQAPPAIVTKIVSLLPESTKWNLFVRTQSQSGRYLREGDVIRSTIRSVDGRVDLGEQVNRVVGAS